MSNNHKAFLLGLTAVLCWSTVATAFKISLRYLRPAELLFYATVSSCILLAVIISSQKKWSVVMKSGLREWGEGIMFGLLNPFFYYLILLNSYALLPAQQAQAINYTWAITLSILSVPFLKQKIQLSQGVAIFFGYLGVVVIATGGNFATLKMESPLGVALALLSTIIWALYWIFNTRDKRDPIVGLFMNFFCGLPFITLYILFDQGVHISHNLNGVAGAVYVGVFEMGLAFICWLYAMKLTSNTARIANLIFLSPILSLGLIYFIVGEKILLSTIAGLGLILIGLFTQMKFSGRN